MDISQERIDALAAAPSESLVSELKRWIDPQTPEGIAKIAKAAIALRNRNGGYLIIGFDDKTLQPDLASIPKDVAVMFSVDIIQGIISRYAHPIFEVQIGFADRNGVKFPVIAVPDGTRVPVACKSALRDSSGAFLLRENEVYFRTLRSNGTPSSSIAKAADWADIVEICFENREADIGRFLRRHLGGDGSGSLANLYGSVQTPPTLEQKTRDLFERSEAIRAEVFEEHDLAGIARSNGSWSVALQFDPPRDVKNSTQEFLNTVGSANPNYTGWPTWMDTQGFAEKKDRPRKRGKAWEVLLYQSGRGIFSHFDYFLMDAKGEFYLWRVLDDDRAEKVPSNTVLDPMLVMTCVTETIAVGLSFARALGYGEEATLGFYFKWEGLKDRKLDPWVNRETYFSFGRTTYDESAEGYVAVPATTAPSAIAPYVQAATADLFASFEGLQFQSQSIEKRVQKIISRNW